MYKKYVSNIVVVILVASMCFSNIGIVYSHSGRTDKAGCHKNSKTGIRHCHGSKTSSNSDRSSNSDTSGDSVTSSISKTSNNRDNQATLGGALIIAGGIVIISYLIYPDSCSCFFNGDISQSMLPEYSDSNFIFPKFDLERDMGVGWRGKLSYTFRF